ncbi:MAG: nickel pincer cofactor biosynthesis protein LarB [Kiritimatiellae bacterium]|nr:nickel pincer cofactor biosynthesis protein LarB [Kiritimatiellia bacterium]
MDRKIKEIEDIAKLDIFRDKRCGIPEFILAEGKNPEDVFTLLIAMAREKGKAMATRVDKKCLNRISKGITQRFRLKYYEKARMAVLTKKDYLKKRVSGKIGILAAGTSDIPVAEEARITCQELGCEVLHAYDVGVAGLHRIFSPLEKLLKENVACIVVVAGMEGALPTVVKSLVDVPVIGVPTSCGYGYGGKGKAALMTMLQSCSPGLVVVNIDNGFGAACAAFLIAGQSKICNTVAVLQKRK